MNKDFKRWNKLKEVLNDRNNPSSIDERKIWYCHFGANIGYELDGKNEDFVRPIITFKVFNKDTLWAIPLTSRKKISKFHMEIHFKGRVSYAILSQMKLIDKKRLIKWIAYIPRSKFREIKNRILEIMNIKVPGENLFTREPEARILIDKIRIESKYILSIYN